MSWFQLSAAAAAAAARRWAAVINVVSFKSVLAGMLIWLYYLMYIYLFIYLFPSRLFDLIISAFTNTEMSTSSQRCEFLNLF